MNTDARLIREGGRFLRFCVVGVGNTALNYATYLLLWGKLGVPYLIAGPIGFLAGAVTGFFLNRAWTFRSNVSTAKGMASYFAVQVPSLASHWAAQWFAGEIVGVPQGWTQLAGILVSMVANFLLLRFVVFRDAAEREGHASGRSD